MHTSEVIERYNRYFKLRKNVEEIVLGLKNAPDYVDMITSSDRLIVEKLGTMAYELDDKAASRRWSVAKPEIYQIYLLTCVIKNNIEKYPFVTIDGTRDIEKFEAFALALNDLALS